MLKKSLLLLFFAVVLNSGVEAARLAPDTYDYAVRLYGVGLYERCREIMDAMQEKGPMSEGYSLLCSEKLRQDGYSRKLEAYEAKYGKTALSSLIHFENARILFDNGNFKDASASFAAVSENKVSYTEYTEVLFKTAYCALEEDNLKEARFFFERVLSRRRSTYSVPSKYALGYLSYSENDFSKAFELFESISKDSQFGLEARYYMVECRFMEKDYAYVVENAPELFDLVPSQRKPHLGRIISEACLIMGDTLKAREYYEKSAILSDSKTRKDYFYAGSLQYALGNYRDAIDNFRSMESFTDSIGQIASYQMAYSYIRAKDKVSAMSSFKLASQGDFDKKIKEDAFFNYSKLSFDLNHDVVPFKDYMAAYPGSGRDEMIYDYIAIAALIGKDYDAAVKAYDNIDVLTPSMASNYLKANYLKARAAYEKGSWTEASSSFRAAAAYAPKGTKLGKMVRYYLAESLYHAGNYAEALELYTDLYNNDALDSMEEGRLLSYNVAYCNFRLSQYDAAQLWFEKYISSNDSYARRDALLRSADCRFILKDYTSASELYRREAEEFPSTEDLYPYYSLGLCYGFLGKNKEKAVALECALTAPSSANMYAESMYELGRAYVALKRVEDAADVFMTLSKSGADKLYAARSLIEIGMMERNAGRYERALECYKSVVERYADTESYEDALLAIESIYTQQNDPKSYFDYVESIGKATKSQAEKEEIIFASAREVFLTENYDRAIVSLNNFLSEYPYSVNIAMCNYYIAESYKALGQKERALEYYSKVVDLKPEGNIAELSMLSFASLSYELGKYEDASGAFESLEGVASLPQNVHNARLGLLRSAYAAGDFERALWAASRLEGDEGADAEEVMSLKAHSLLRLSRRSEAYELFEALSSNPSTLRGAEAAYLVIQDVYDGGRFSEVENLVYKFADKAGDQSYYLAKAFIVLGDSFVENDNIRQAKVTFESIRDGYSASEPDDDIIPTVLDRLEKLSKIEQ